MTPLILAGVLAIISVGIFAASRLARGRRRLLGQRIGLYTAVPSVTVLLVLLPLQYDLSFADGLSLAGLVLSVVFALGTPALDRVFMRVRIGIVIPSRVPFHSELRAGLKEAMSDVRLDVYDDYLKHSGAIENLADFLPSLRRTLAWGPDYLVVCSPSVGLVSSPQVITLLTSFTKRGGGVVFVDNEPTETARKSLRRRYGRVTSDVATGARFIAAYVKAHAMPTDHILVLCGPPSSDPAELRRQVFTEMLPDATITVADTGGWTAEGAHGVTIDTFKNVAAPRYVVCGNDVMAFGVIRALRELSRSTRQRRYETHVIGYDGIARALFAIAEPENPFVATIRTPPSAYGHEIAAMILSDARMLRRRSCLSDCNIPVAEGQLITANNVEMALDG